MERAYSKFAAELLKAIRRRYDEGNPALINDDMQKLIRRYDIEYQYANGERRKIENQLMNDWINDRTLKSDNKIGSYEGKFEQNSTSFATMQGGFKRDIKRSVDRGLRNQMSLQQITELIKRTANIGSGNSRTVARTAKMGQIRAKYLITHIKAGCKKFRYAGVSGAAGTVSGPRDFCMRHLGKIYIIEEILQLNNGQGLSVLLYMGGWNCRHRWEAVYENDENNIFVSEQWETALETARNSSGKLNNMPNNSYDTMINERKTAEILNNIGKKVILDSNVKNKRGAPCDVIIDGIAAEIKHPESRKAKSILGAINRDGGYENRQSDYYVFHITKELKQTELDKLDMNIKIIQSRYPITIITIFDIPNESIRSKVYELPE